MPVAAVQAASANARTRANILLWYDRARQVTSQDLHSAQMATDPVCGMSVDPASPGGGSWEHAGQTYYFCNPGCREKFRAHPAKYLAPKNELAAPKGAVWICPMD